MRKNTELSGRNTKCLTIRIEVLAFIDIRVIAKRAARGYHIERFYFKAACPVIVNETLFYLQGDNDIGLGDNGGDHRRQVVCKYRFLDDLGEEIEEG